MKKLLIIFALIASVVQPSKAVLTGNDVNQTISMLNSELKIFDERVDSISHLFNVARAKYNTQFNVLTKELASVSIMFYSQQDRFIFGQAYAAEKGNDLCRRFEALKGQSGQWLVQYNTNYDRCQKLLATLQGIDPNKLSPDGMRNRRECMATIEQVLHTLDMWNDNLEHDKVALQSLDDKVDLFKADIENCYSHLHTRVFLARDIPYHSVIANFGSEAKGLWSGILTFFNPSVFGWEYQKQWAHSGNLILLVFFITFIIGIIIGRFIFVRWFSSSFDTVETNKQTITLLIGWSLSTFAMQMLYLFVLDNPFYLSSVEIFSELGVLCIVITGSILFRVPAEKARITMRGYTPTFILTAITLGYRITLSDVSMLRVSFVPILIFCTFIQWRFNAKKHDIARFDSIVNSISLWIYVVASIVGWAGFYFLSAQIVTFWSILLTGHLLLSCIYGFLAKHDNYKMKTVANYKDSFFYITLKQLAMPAIFIVVVGACLYEAAHVFNINEWFDRLFTAYFIDYPGKVRISVVRIFEVVCIALVVNYIVSLLHSIAKSTYGDKARVGSIGMIMKVVAILFWGVFAIIALGIFEVNGVGIVAVISGITVGVGIALRETLDCFFCGLSLMMGRLHIDDMVECEGVRGKVLDIQYRTTQILTDEGAVISFFNTAFFGKSYRNLNALGEYQREHLYFKMQKDADITKMRPILEKALIEKIPELAKNPAPEILFESTDRFYMTLFAQVWLPVRNYCFIRSKVKEIIFLTMKEHGISNMMEDKRTVQVIEK